MEYYVTIGHRRHGNIVIPDALDVYVKGDLLFVEQDDVTEGYNFRDVSYVSIKEKKKDNDGP